VCCSVLQCVAVCTPYCKILAAACSSDRMLPFAIPVPLQVLVPAVYFCVSVAHIKQGVPSHPPVKMTRSGRTEATRDLTSAGALAELYPSLTKSTKRPVWTCASSHAHAEPESGRAAASLARRRCTPPDFSRDTYGFLGAGRT